MAGVPQLGVTIDFSNGPAFIDAAGIIGEAIIGTAQISDSNSSVNITDEVLQIATRRGRNRLLDTMEAGTATVILKDTDGRWNPANAAGPYYGLLLPNRKISIWATYEGVKYTVFTGFITAFPIGFVNGVGDQSKVVLTCVDGFRLLYNAGVDVVAATGAGQYTGTRIGKMLDEAAWPAGQRDIDAGNSTLQADPGGVRSVLAACQMIEKSEFGGFFMTKRGKARFMSRTAVGTAAAQTATTFADDGSGISYQDIAFAFDDTLILNDVTVTRAGGVAQNVYDQTSIDTYFNHSGSRTGLLVETDAEALQQAQLVLSARKDATVRIDYIALNLFDSAATTRIVAGLNAEIFDLINVTKQMPGSTAITRELFVQGVQHDATPKSWTAKLLTSEPLVQAFIIGDPVQGQVGGVGVISY
ncbi:hypothetical protein UFOVP1616_55 [uncultured Caudovirales phage]|uniref:Uncharacterized protein n=1 Tax=uncultured Caudovirales phage TaxID=2100421 RepID=A0A6J5SYC4_9CAUD|nr:hypothetical protein UFOVP1467_8 [uncultured Caudovirales phage]CAB4219674.1 hypothetical protein UFOVP1616_55 [uncultured Caudovirales phage]